VAAKKSIEALNDKLEKKLNQKASNTNMAIDDLATSIVGTRTEVNLLDNKLANLESKIEKELCTVKEDLKDNPDVILRQQGERVELSKC
jgi:hypothetical protein